MKEARVRKTIVKAVLILTIAVFIIPAFAAENAGGGRRPKAPLARGDKHHFVEKILDEMGLTSEQKTALIENKKLNRREMRSINEQIRAERKAMHAVFIKPDADRSSLDAHVERLKTLEAQKIDNFIAGMFSAKEILTPEQFTAFMEKMGRGYGRQGMMEKRRKHKRHLTEKDSDMTID
jgi:Spy/CpxP family protein refolding chaperone